MGMAKQRYGLIALAAVALVIHGGTALLRLNTFWPSPRLVDFAAFYAGAWALRLGLTPYEFTPPFLDKLATRAALSFSPPIPFNPPFFYLLMPFSWLPFPVAAWIWLFLNLLVLTWTTRVLGRLAGVSHRWIRLLPVVITFGPVFLDLTLGQLSTLLLGAALLMGQSLKRTSPRLSALAALAGALAVTLKVYPLMWMGAWPFLRRWRVVLLSLLFLATTFILASLIGPPNLVEDWLRHFRERVTSAQEAPGVDDQSLTAWLTRVGRPQRLRVPGLVPAQQELVEWTPPWDVNPLILRVIGYTAAASLAAGTWLFLFRNGTTDPEGAFYLWVLVSLIIVPHMERYNHTLLLPAMAWLWGRGERGQTVAVMAYFLAGLARLTHLWSLVLPAPWGPLATGFGLYATLLLGGGMAALLRSQPSKE